MEGPNQMSNHYQIGLRTPVRVGGAIRVGAMTNADYTNQARQVFAGMGKDYVLIVTSATGQMSNHDFATKSELDDAYGVATTNPAEAASGKPAAYVAMFDRKSYAGTSTPDPLLEEAFFATPPPPKPEGNIGAAVAIGLAGVAGLVVAGGKKKRGV